MIRNKLLIISAIAFILLASATIFGLAHYQNQIADKIVALFNNTDKIKDQIITSSFPHATSTEEELTALRKEIEDLRNRPPQTIYKTVMTPASPSPLPDLKTQEELKEAKDQISSLQQQLSQIQTQQAQQSTAPINEANLIKSWQANEKVAQIACENKFLGSWQLGSAVLISTDGKLLTNQHVVEPSVGLVLPDYCIVMFNADLDPQTQKYKKEYRATITGFFTDRDAALLKIYDQIYLDTGGTLKSAPLSGSFKYFDTAKASPQIGDTVYVIGYPESAKFSYSVTKGIVSNFTQDNLYLGTDAQIDRGNSGGAAINAAGQLMGLPTWKFVSSGDYRGYILDINSLKLN